MKIQQVAKALLLIPACSFLICSVSTAAEPLLDDYTAYPVFTVNPVKPNILIMLDNSGSMNHNAYGSAASNGSIITDQPYRGIPYPYELTYRVSHSEDDAEEFDNGSSHYNNGSADLDLGRFSTSNTSIVGVRFRNLDIPQGATITKAWLDFTVQRVPTGTQATAGGEYAPISLEIAGFAEDSTGVFTTVTNDITTRPVTTSTVVWDNSSSPSTASWEPVNDIKSTPELKTIVQEIVNRTGWVRGNAMGFRLQYSAVDPNAKRDAYSYDGSPSYAPVLHIEYNTPVQEAYYGYFNPEWFYVYSSNKFQHQYKKDSYNYTSSCWNVYTKAQVDLFNDSDPTNDPTSTTTCLSDSDIVNEELWDGNWANWASMRRIDIARKVIMGGLATSRQGNGNQVNYGEDPAQGNRHFRRDFDSSKGAAVTPYSDGANTVMYGVDGGYLMVDTDNDDSPFDNGGSDRFTLAIDKLQAYDGRDFKDDGNVGGVMQKFWDKAWWGNEFFYRGDGTNREGGYIASSIGTNMPSLITDLQNTGADTWTPLSEAYYVAMQYFKQEDPEDGLGFHNSAIGATNYVNDPYYQDGEFVECAPSFVILLTDGASTKDSKIPSFLKDYDGDGDNTSCDESSNSNCDYPSGGSDYLDDVALYARTNDLRNDLDGEQNIILYTVYAFGNDANARNLLRDAARNGGFDDLNGNSRPDGTYSDPPADRKEWDLNQDGDPDTFFEASDGYKLEDALGDAINDILKRASSGTAVSVLATSGEGEGTISQAYFRPEVKTGANKVKWTGYLQSLWIDQLSNLREDTNGNYALDLGDDMIIKYFVDATGNTVVRKYQVDEIVCSSRDSDVDDATACSGVSGTTTGFFNSGACECEEINYPEIEITCSSTDPLITDDVACAGVSGDVNGTFNSGQCYCDDGAITEVAMDQITPIWEAGKQLATMTNPDSATRGRTLITTLDGNGGGAFYGGIEFNTANSSSLMPYFGIKDSTAWDYLGKYTTTVGQPDRSNNLIRFVRGFDSGFTGETAIRSRLTDVNGTDLVWKLSDIVHSTPMTISKPLENYNFIYRDESYDAYYRKHINRETVVYVGSNGGMLHAFASWEYDETNRQFTRPTVASASEEIGDELWAYIPKALLPHLKWLPRTDYTHVYYVDLRPKVIDAKIFTPDPNVHVNGWGTILIGGLRMGGKPIDVTDDFDSNSATADTTETFSASYFAIDITDPRNPELLWERSFDGLNMTTLRPNVVRVGDRWFTVVGSGPTDYDGSSDTTAKIYVVDIATGNATNNGSQDWLFEPSEDQAFMGGVASLDYNLNYNVDSIYMTHTWDDNTNVNQDPDWQGSLYRVAVPWSCGAACPEKYGTVGSYDTDGNGSDDCECKYNDDPLTWTMHKLYDADDVAITAEPSISTDFFRNIWVYFGTGRYLSQADKSTDFDNYMVGLKDPFFNRDHQSPDTAGYHYAADATSRPYYQDSTKNITVVENDLFVSDDHEVIFPWGYYEAPAGDCSTVPTGAVGDIFGDGSCLASYDWPDYICESAEAGIDDATACAGVSCTQLEGPLVGPSGYQYTCKPANEQIIWGCLEKVAFSGACDTVPEGVVADTADYKSLYWKQTDLNPPDGCAGVSFGDIVDTATCKSEEVTPPSWSYTERPVGDCTSLGVKPPMEGDMNNDGGSCFAGYWACDETVSGGCDSVDFTIQTGFLGTNTDGDINGDGSCMCAFVTEPVARVISTTSTAALTFDQLIDESRLYEGWKRTLIDPKERSINKPTLFGGLSLFTSYIPSDATCSFGGESYMYGLYFETGTAFKREVFEDGSEWDSSSSTYEPIDRISLSTGLTSAPTIHVGKQEKNKAEVLINKSTGEIKTIEIDPAFKIRSGLRYWYAD